MSQNQKKWTKPKDVMRTRLQRRSSEVGDRSRADSTKPKNESYPSNKEAQESSEDTGRKRKNPFNVTSTASRRNTSESSEKKPSVTSAGDTADQSTEKGKRLFSALDYANQLQEGTSDKKNQPDLKKWSVTSGDGKKAEKGGGVESMEGKGRGTPSVVDPAGGDGQKIRKKEDTPSTALSMDTQQEDSEEQESEEIPMDWSLKVKLRIIFHTNLFPTPQASDNRYALMTRVMLMEPSEERKARAMLGFVHHKPLTEGSSQTRVESVMLSLRQCCHYWVYPSLPGFPDFPRITTYKRDEVCLELGYKPMVQKVLLNNWLESIASVYEQVKKGQCPYFYLCAHHFTALFYMSTEGHRTLSACVTPTTRGLREAMSREGVEFTMPYRQADKQQRTSTGGSESSANPQKKSKDSSSQAADENEDEDNDDDEDLDITATDEGATEWLKEVGLDQKSFPTLHPSKVRIQREGYQKVDGRRESLIMCQYRAVQALYNYLINSRQCTAITGPQAGIPPTIIAPTPFGGATLKSNRIQHSRARVTSETSSEVRHVLDITGPLMPHQLLNITAALQGVEDLSAGLSINTHEPTVPFNFVSNQPEASVHGASPAPQTSQGTSSKPPDHPGSAKSGTENNQTTGAKPSTSKADTSVPDTSSVSEVVSHKTQTVGDTKTPPNKRDPDLVKASGSGEKMEESWEADPSDCIHCSSGAHRGLHPSVRHRLCVPSTLSTATALREIYFDNGELSWSC